MWTLRMVALSLVPCLLALTLVDPAGAEPRIQLKLPAFPGSAFANFSSLVLPQTNHGSLEIWLEEALSEVQVSTVRVKLNDMPMTPFVGVNVLPGGLKVVVRLGASANPEYNLQPQIENLLTFVVEDKSRMKYQAQFYLTLDAKTTAPMLGAVRREAPVKAVEAPLRRSPPEVSFKSDWPAQTAQQFLHLMAEVSDAEALRRVVVEVNGKDEEEIVFENEWPVRKHRGFMSGRKVPGEVTGDGKHLTISIPVKLTKEINVVAIRAENSGGLRTRLDRTVERLKER